MQDSVVSASSTQANTVAVAVENAAGAGAPLNRRLYGLIAEFDDAHDLVAAAAKARDAGYKKMDAYAPFPVEGLSAALGIKDFSIPLMMLVAGIAGCIGGFAFLTWATMADYPLNIGGRPLWGWPSFIPITFEMTVLCSALTGVFGMIIINGLPMPYHPVFNAPNFAKASSDRFFLCIEESDPAFSAAGTRQFMDDLRALNVAEVYEEH